MIKTLAIVGILTWTGGVLRPVHAQTAESRVSMATDAADHHLFNENPSINHPDQSALGYLQFDRARTVQVTYNWDNQQPVVDHEATEKFQTLGFVYSLGGGAAVGVTAQSMAHTIESKIDITEEKHEETVTRFHGNARFIVELVSEIRMALAIRYTKIESDVEGAFFLDNDRTDYNGAMNGYSVGAFYDKEPFGFGAAYTPPMKGKATKSKEEILIAEPGFINLDATYGKKKDWRIGAAAKRWLHRRDDRAIEDQSPNDQRDISLNGLDFEQFLLPTSRYSLGVDTPFFHAFYARLSVAQQQYSFLFEGDTVPGDEPGLETEVTANSIRVAVAAQYEAIVGQVGYHSEERSVGTIDDTEGWFAGDYSDYSAKESYLFLSVHYKP